MLDVVEELFQQGVELHKSGKVEVASQLYTAVLNAHPKHPEANYNMGLLTVGSGEMQAGLAFLETALETNADNALYWLSYIDTLHQIGRIEDAQAVFNQAKNNGAKGEGFDQLEQRLKALDQAPLETSGAASLAHQDQPNILESLKLDQALSLAKKKAKEGSFAEAKCIYHDILVKFPKNKRARDGIEVLAGKLVSKASQVQEPSQDQLQALIDLHSQGQLEQVLKQTEALIVQFPKSPVLLNIQGASLSGLGQLDLSIEAYDKALAIEPDNAEIYNNTGIVLKEQGKLEEAIEAYNKALAIKSDNAEVYNNIGNALKDQGKLEEAIAAYNKALTIKSDYAEPYYNMGNAFENQDKLDEAIEAYNKAITIKPDYADAYYNMGNALKEQGKLEETIEAYNKAITIKPDFADAHYNSSFALLNSGRLKEGLDAYEWRWKTAKCNSPRRHFLQPLWDGKTSLQDKRVLVWCEQGIGDTVKWSSRLSLLASQAGHCILECQKKLVPLLSRSFPNVEVKPVDVSRDAERDDFDFHLPMASLYRHFIPEITRSPKPDAFLIPDPVRVKFWKDSLSSLGDGPYVGISWKSSLMGAERSKHYSSLSEWSSLFALPNINFINLQYADAADGLLQIQNEFGVKVHNFDDLDQYNDLDDVAALSAALDCVVAFSSSVPMITAGVGTLTKSVWLGHHLNIHTSPVGPFLDTYGGKVGEPWSNVFGLIADDIIKL